MKEEQRIPPSFLAGTSQKKSETIKAREVSVRAQGRLYGVRELESTRFRGTEVVHDPPPWAKGKAPYIRERWPVGLRAVHARQEGNPSAWRPFPYCGAPTGQEVAW